MMTVLIVSTVLLTVCVLALGVGVFVLARQIGVLHERLAPIGVQPVLAGLQAGQALPQITARTLDGAAVSVGGLNPSGRAMVLMFVSADCPVCKRTLPTARSVAKEHDLDLVLIGEGDVAALSAMASRTSLDGVPLLLSTELLLLMQIERLPTLVALDARGVITAREIASSRREIEALVATLPPVRQALTEESLHVAV
ncbi:redoxin family protein [Acetobacter senegalensis]|uniref:redoxin family protein n=1 Tax=Acetobacter senegalensis TaxID=446692 RepID=UPI00264BCBB3|nr:redoxin family protein [Acetobacter senegalensis]MDN7353336.1 redoxin family protein [Acetobacter senegalensis]